MPVLSTVVRVMRYVLAAWSITNCSSFKSLPDNFASLVIISFLAVIHFSSVKIIKEIVGLDFIGMLLHAHVQI